jgi:hypothetical protein
MVEIRGRGRILAAQLFLSTMEITNLRGALECIAQKDAKNCTTHESRMEQGLSCIDFRLSL